jgi:hypothetical protein
VKPVFLLGCYGCIFHETGNSSQLCQNLEIGEGVAPHPHTPLAESHDKVVIFIVCKSFCLIHGTFIGMGVKCPEFENKKINVFSC